MPRKGKGRPRVIGANRPAELQELTADEATLSVKIYVDLAKMLKVVADEQGVTVAELVEESTLRAWVIPKYLDATSNMAARAKALSDMLAGGNKAEKKDDRTKGPR